MREWRVNVKWGMCWIPRYGTTALCLGLRVSQSSRGVFIGMTLGH